MSTSIRSAQSTSSSKSLEQILRRHPLFWYFFLSYAFSWIIILPYVLSVWGVLPGNYILGYSLKQWVGPALAGILMILVMEGKSGVRSFRRRWWQWRAGWQWYLFILLGVPALLLLGIVLLPAGLSNFQGLQPRFLANYLVYFIIVFIGVGLPEEIGWRGFALPRMQRQYGPLWGTFMLGFLWTFWHLLFFFTPVHGGGPGTSLADVMKNIFIFFVMVEALSILFTWVYNHTQGSVFIAGLLHAAIDTPQTVWVPLFLSVGAFTSTSGEASLNLALLVPFSVLAVLIVILTRGRLGYQPEQEQAREL